MVMMLEYGQQCGAMVDKIASFLSPMNLCVFT